MFIPSIVQPDEPMKVEESDGMFCVVNAYSGTRQEFFEGRVIPVDLAVTLAASAAAAAAATAPQPVEQQEVTYLANLSGIIRH